MLGDLWARAQIPASMTREQAVAWLTANDHEVSPEATDEIMDVSASMDEFQFVPDPNEHLRVMGETALRISELLLPRPWYVATYGSPVLLTSDEPVALHFRDASRRFRAACRVALLAGCCLQISLFGAAQRRQVGWPGPPGLPTGRRSGCPAGAAGTRPGSALPG